jgi:hypothetical protein
MPAKKQDAKIATSDSCSCEPPLAAEAGHVGLNVEGASMGGPAWPKTLHRREGAGRKGDSSPGWPPNFFTASVFLKRKPGEGGPGFQRPMRRLPGGCRG